MAEITVTFTINDHGTTLIHVGSQTSGNPIYHPQELEQLIAEAGRKAVALAAGTFGDIRNHPDTPDSAKRRWL